MGYFKDAFNISAGATLGNIAAATGAQVCADWVNEKFRRAYNNYRSQSFDPVVRHDLNELLVFGRLPQQAYPFPNSNKSNKKDNFFRRHKKFTALLVATFGINLLINLLNMLGVSYSTLSDLQFMTGVLGMALVISSIVMVIKKISRSGKNKLSSNFKAQLEYDGQQYWYMREYVRQALARGEMDINTAVTKICNTRLAQQFPDTVDKIEANAFYYRQKMGV